MQPETTAYDEVSYPAGAYAQSHVDRLETLGRLFGMVTPDTQHCHVLELACADGSNLIPMACALPESQFVGIDLAQTAVERGTRTIEALGLSNIKLRRLDISNWDTSAGKFDYIIAHGIYSWVPAEVQDKILQICQAQLSENGVAYISYNTYPGWRMRGLLRDMMLYHARRFEEPQEQVQQARALIEWLGRTVTAESPYGQLLQSELSQMRRWQDNYLRHDSLGEVNDPIYFHQFIERAGRHELQYLAEAEFPTMLANNYPPEVSKTLNLLGRDIVELEQYMDFVRNRLFRQTLLCRRGLRLQRALGPWSVANFRVAANLQFAATECNLNSSEEEVFRGASHFTLSTKDRLVKAALVYLARQWPGSIPLAELARRGWELLWAGGKGQGTGSGDTKADEHTLGNVVLTCFTRGLCELRVQPGAFRLAVGDRPTACPYARWQAAQGNQVINRRHELVALDVYCRHLLPLLNSHHDRVQLVEHLTASAVEGRLTVTANNEPVRESETLRPLLEAELERRLQVLARCALLVG